MSPPAKQPTMNFNIYASRLEDGKVPIGGADDRTFPGTATPYLPDDPAASLMYAFKVSRNCGSERNCLTLALDRLRSADHRQGHGPRPHLPHVPGASYQGGTRPVGDSLRPRDQVLASESLTLKPDAENVDGFGLSVKDKDGGARSTSRSTAR